MCFVAPTLTGSTEQDIVSATTSIVKTTIFDSTTDSDVVKSSTDKASSLSSGTDYVAETRVTSDSTETTKTISAGSSLGWINGVITEMIATNNTDEETTHVSYLQTEKESTIIKHEGTASTTATILHSEITSAPYLVADTTTQQGEAVTSVFDREISSTLQTDVTSDKQTKTAYPVTDLATQVETKSTPVFDTTTQQGESVTSVFDRDISSILQTDVTSDKQTKTAYPVTDLATQVETKSTPVFDTTTQQGESVTSVFDSHISSSLQSDVATDKETKTAYPVTDSTTQVGTKSTSSPVIDSSTEIETKSTSAFHEMLSFSQTNVISDTGTSTGVSVFTTVRTTSPVFDSGLTSLSQINVFSDGETTSHSSVADSTSQIEAERTSVFDFGTSQTDDVMHKTISESPLTVPTAEVGVITLSADDSGLTSNSQPDGVSDRKTTTAAFSVTGVKTSYVFDNDMTSILQTGVVTDKETTTKPSTVKAETGTTYILNSVITPISQTRVTNIESTTYLPVTNSISHSTTSGLAISLFDSKITSTSRTDKVTTEALSDAGTTTSVYDIGLITNSQTDVVSDEDMTTVEWSDQTSQEETETSSIFYSPNDVVASKDTTPGSSTDSTEYHDGITTTPIQNAITIEGTLASGVNSEASLLLTDRTTAISTKDTSKDIITGYNSPDLTNKVNSHAGTTAHSNTGVTSPSDTVTDKQVTTVATMTHLTTDEVSIEMKSGTTPSSVKSTGVNSNEITSTATYGVSTVAPVYLLSDTKSSMLSSRSNGNKITSEYTSTTKKGKGTKLY